MKVFFIGITLAFANSAFSAAHICEIKEFREEVDTKGEYCVKEVKKRNNGSEYTKYTMNKRSLSELAALTGKSVNDLFYDDRFWCGSECHAGLISNFKDQVATRDLNAQNPNKQESFKSLVIAANETQKAQERVEQELQVANAALDVAPEQVYQDFAGDKPKYSFEQINSFRCDQEEACMKQRASFTRFDTERRGEISQSLETAKSRLAGMGDTLDRIAEGIDSSYGDGKFKKIALNKLVKADPALKDQLKDPNTSIEAVCKERSSKGQTARNKTDDAVISTCDKIKAEAHKISSLRSEVADLKEDISDSSGLDFLSLKINLQDLEAKERLAALSDINKEANAKLKGTILGHMMDQMREDMCTVANNPGAMCAGTAFSTQEFVNDASEVTKDLATEFFNSRSTSSSSSKATEN